MLPQRIISTLRFFDLQGVALTGFELHKYLLPAPTVLKQNINEQYEVAILAEPEPSVPLSEVLLRLGQLVELGQVSCRGGYYSLPSHDDEITARLANHRYAIMRERRIARFSRALRFVPFVRGVALGGSQAFGLPKADSDIDMLVITDPEFMWLGRVFVTSYFQLTGYRRHGAKIANRFCLNHYVAGTLRLIQDRNLYSAMEYLRLRPLVGTGTVHKFVQKNLDWITPLYPNAAIQEVSKDTQPWLQRALEFLFRNRFGAWLNARLGVLQLSRISTDPFIIANEKELSFHPNNRKAGLFRTFFENQKEQQGNSI